ncbi:hypothetical protein CPC08DRAFT_713691 [Agrocybe pediades]|nr:hypothetical protein CPC08DRAFT_713691 [Agrocybe pediades]
MRRFRPFRVTVPCEEDVWRLLGTRSLKIFGTTIKVYEVKSPDAERLAMLLVGIGGWGNAYGVWLWWPAWKSILRQRNQ